MESSTTHGHGWRFWAMVALGVWLTITIALIVLALVP
jgi:hypothetical protein